MLPNTLGRILTKSLFTLAVFAGVTAVLNAATVVPTMQLISQSGDVYDYAIVAPLWTEAICPGCVPAWGFRMLPGQSISLSGMADVTSGYGVGMLDFTNSAVSELLQYTNTSTSASLTFLGQTPTFSADSFLIGNEVSDLLETFEVTSTAPETGLIAYTIEDSVGSFTGSVEGPVTESAPEPASAWMLVVGALCFVPTLRRKSNG